MNRDTQRELVRRVLGYLDAGTTAMADAVFQNPVSAYTSRERAAREREILFRRYPLLVGLSCQLREAGDYLTENDSGVPILVVRQPSGGLAAFMNVCRHRGSRVVDGCGSGKRALTCPYHAWTYDLDGRLIRIPGEEGFPNLAAEQRALRRLPVVEKHGLVWVRPTVASDEADTFDIDEHLAGLAPELQSYGFGDYHHFETRALRPRINWKMAIDTFQEAYHLSALHKDTVGPIFINNVCASDGYGLNNRMIAIRRSIEDLRGRGEEEWNLLEHSIELYTLFPNTVFIHQVDHIEVWRMFPDHECADACTVYLSLYVPEAVTSEKARRHWAANMQLAVDAVDDEDFRLGEGIQRGYYSGAQDCVTYGRNEPSLIHFHRSVRTALALD